MLATIAHAVKNAFYSYFEDGAEIGHEHPGHDGFLRFVDFAL